MLKLCWSLKKPMDQARACPSFCNMTLQGVLYSLLDGSCYSITGLPPGMKFAGCGRSGGLMFSALNSGMSSPGLSPDRDSVHGVLGQDILLSWCLSLPRCINMYWEIYCWG